MTLGKIPERSGAILSDPPSSHAAGIDSGAFGIEPRRSATVLNVGEESSVLRTTPRPA